MQAKRIFLIRHGESDYNASGRWQGQLPTPLNARGFAQARALAGYLKGSFQGEIYASDIPRAYQTAQTIAQETGYSISVDQRLREVDVGYFQGLTRYEILQRFAKEYASWNQSISFAAPGGESRLQMRERAYAALMDILDRSASSQILIVTHGGVIRSLLAFLFYSGESLPDIANTSITTIEYHENRWRLIEAAALPHLNGA